MKDIAFNTLSHRKLIAVLLVMGFMFLMLGNGVVSLTHPDEVFYAQTAKEMVERGSWSTPYIFGAPHFEKPILVFWLMAATFEFFGISAFAARFWPSFFAIMGMAVTYWMAWMMFKNKRTALLSGFILGTSTIYLALSRAVLTDMVFSVLVITSLAFFYFGYSSPRHKRLGIIFAFVFSGLAVLAKGVLGFLFPGTTVLVFLIYKKDLAFLKDWSVLLGAVLFAVIVAPWHILMYQLHGQKFIDEYWWNVHIKRLYHAEHQKSNTWYFYLGTMFGGVFPWSLFLIPAGYLAYRQVRYPNPYRDAIAFLFLWILMVYWCVQPAQSKLASYHLPLFPALAIVLANYFDNVLGRVQNVFLQKAVPAILYTIAGLLLVGSAAAIFFSREHIDIVIDVRPVYVLSVLCVITGVIIIVLCRRRDYAKAILANSLIVVIMLTTLFLGKPYAETWVSCKGAADLLKKLDQSGSVVLSSKFFVRGIRYYTDREMAVIDINGSGFFTPHPIPFLNSDQKVLEFLSTQPVTYAVVKHSNVDDLQRIARDGQYAVSFLGEDGGKFILKLEPKKSAAAVTPGPSHAAN